jgi:hypothetical protein
MRVLTYQPLSGSLLFLASKTGVSKNPPKFVVLEVLILLDIDV